MVENILKKQKVLFFFFTSPKHFAQSTLFGSLSVSLLDKCYACNLVGIKEMFVELHYNTARF